MGCGTSSSSKKKMDVYSAFLYTAAQKHIKDKLKTVLKAKEQMALPTLQKALKKSLILGKLDVMEAFSDEEAPQPIVRARGRAAICLVACWNAELPLTNPADEEPFATIEEAVQYYKKEFDPGVLSPLPNLEWKDVTSDDVLSLFCTQGLGVLRLRKFDAPAELKTDALAGAMWVSRTSSMSKYHVRAGYETYGVDMYLDANQKVLCACKDGKFYRPQDKEWQHVAFAFRTSCFIYTTMIDHLLITHFMVAEGFAIHTREQLAPNHELRRLLSPFYFRTPAINFNALTSLIPEGGLVHRASSFVYDDMVNFMTDCIPAYKFRTFPEEVRDNHWDDLKSPFVEDGLQLFDVILQFVTRYVTFYYRTDADIEKSVFVWWGALSKHIGALPPLQSVKQLCELVTQFIWSASGFHEMSGAVVEYTMHPGLASSRYRPQDNCGTVSATVLIGIVNTLTGIRMPSILDDYSFFGLVPETQQMFKDFRHSLLQLSELIDARNVNRPQPFQAFNPKYLECSVSS